MDCHQLHRAHAEPGDRLMADENQIRPGARNQLAPNLVGSGTDDRTPETGSEERDQDDEEDDDEPARGGAPAQRTRPIAPTRRRGFPRV